MAVDYKESAAKIVELVGGNDNIKSVTHCITRVRFFLKDQELAHNNTEAVSKVPGVIQVVEAGGQYQCASAPPSRRCTTRWSPSPAREPARLTPTMTTPRRRR